MRKIKNHKKLIKITTQVDIPIPVDIVENIGRVLPAGQDPKEKFRDIPISIDIWKISTVYYQQSDREGILANSELIFLFLL